MNGFDELFHIFKTFHQFHRRRLAGYLFLRSFVAILIFALLLATARGTFGRGVHSGALAATPITSNSSRSSKGVELLLGSSTATRGIHDSCATRGHRIMAHMAE